MILVENQRGSALLGAVLVTVILSMLGTVSLNLATHEIVQIGASKDGTVAEYLAEAGTDVVMQWIHDPGSIPDGRVREMFAKRFDLPENGPSFFDTAGHSQFTGTSTNPDILYDASRPLDDQVLNNSDGGWFRSLSSLGRILKLKVYGPSRPGLLCTVEVTGGSRESMRTLAVQFGAWSIPALRAGVQIGNNGVSTDHEAVFPVWLHWGEMKIKGDAHFGNKEEFPAKTQLASVTGRSYAESSLREDRWLEIFVGRDAVFFPSSSSAILPTNLYPQQDPRPGLHQDHWDYETMKKYAILFGSYYARGHDGLLYRNGTIEPGLGLTPDEVFRSQFVGDHHGLVFIDTLDQLPPRADNLGTVSLTTEYAEGLFIVNAHLNLNPTGAGKSVPALSPPSIGSTSLGTRIPVELSNIHIQGVLYTAGNLSFEGQPRLYGALLTEGRVVTLSKTFSAVEVWYNHDLRSGLFRGVPLVYVAPGTWQPKY